jgi:metallo-beta-lactamase family protein
VERDRNAEVAVLNGFSAHADQRDLVAFAEAVRERGPLRHVALVHGEEKAQFALMDLLALRGFPSVSAPTPGQTLSI